MEWIAGRRKNHQRLTYSHLPDAQSAKGAALQSPVDLMSARQRALTVFLLVRGPHPKWSPCPLDRAPFPGCAANRLSERGKYNQFTPFLSRGSLKETKGNNQERSKSRSSSIYIVLRK
jgi:hypothetical protein